MSKSLIRNPNILYFIKQAANCQLKTCSSAEYRGRLSRFAGLKSPYIAVIRGKNEPH